MATPTTTSPPPPGTTPSTSADGAERAPSRPALSPSPPIGSRPTPDALGLPSWRGLTLTLVSLDAVALTVAFGLAYLLRFKLGLPLLSTPPYSGAFYSSVALWAVPVWLGLLAIHRLYDHRSLFAGAGEYVRVVQASTAGLVAVVLLSFFYEGLLISRGWLVLTWVLAAVLVTVERFGVRRRLRSLRRRGRFLTPTLIVGANAEGVALAEQLMADPAAGPRVLGFIDTSGTCAPGATMGDGWRVLGGLNQVDNLVQACGGLELVVATTALAREQLLDLYRAFGQDERVELRLSSGLFEILTTGVRVHEVGNVPLMTPLRVRITGVDAWLKGALDYVAAGLALAVLSPVFLVLALWVRLDSPGPALHRRRVLGVSGRPFDAFKFRTMVVNADEVLARDPDLRAQFEAGYKLKHDPRITRAGRLLRKSSLDELPQLLNVVRGEMSLVGPRMIAPDEAERYGQWQMNLLTVKPGITGPWQVQGRSDLPYPERVRLSMQYIRNWSLWLDLEILLRTVWVVFKGRGAY